MEYPQEALSGEEETLRRRVADLEALTTKLKAAEQSYQTQLNTERLARAEAEKLQQLCLMLHSTLNHEMVLDYVLELVAQFTGFDAACLLLETSPGVVRVTRWTGYVQYGVEAAFFSDSFQVDKISALETMRQSGSPCLRPDTGQPDNWIHAYGKAWVKSHLAAPVRIKGRLAAFLLLDSKTSHHFNQHYAACLTNIATQFGIALTNSKEYGRVRVEGVQQMRAMKEERNFVSAILNSESALVLVFNPSGQILRSNRAFERATGYNTTEIYHKRLTAFLSPTDPQQSMELVLRRLQSGSPINQFSSYCKTKLGREKIISWSINVLTTPSGQVEHIISTGIDITDQSQLKERLLAIHQLSRELNLLRDETEICKIAIETAAFLLHLQSSGYGLLDSSGNHYAYTYYPQCGNPYHVQLKTSTNRDRRLQQLAQQRLVVAEQQQPLTTDTKPLNGAGPQWLTIAMRVRDTTIGVLDLQSRAAYQFSSDEQQLLQTLADQTAVALENARLYKETHNRIDELTTLSTISQAINATLNLEETLTFITKHTTRLTDAAAASVALCDVSSGDLWFQAASGGMEDMVRGMHLSAGQGIVGWVVTHNQPVLVTDVSQDPRFYDKFDKVTGFRTESVICVPLLSGDNVIGAIEVMNKRNGDFNETDLQVLARLAAPAAIAISNARLFEAEQLARQQAERLRETTAMLTSTLELEQVLDTLLVQLEQVVPYHNAYVLLHQDDGLVVVASKGSTESHNEAPKQYSLDNPRYQTIWKRGQPLILDDVQTSTEPGLWAEDTDIRSWMGVPLCVRDIVVGCLTLDSQEIATFDQAAGNLAMAFANQATAAIQNARLFQRVRTGHRQLQSLSHRLVQVQETERRRIARELHDEAGQALTSLLMGLRMLEKEAADAGQVAERVTALQQVTNDISENLHRLAIDLRPASLDYLGLVAALHQYIQGFGQQHKLEIRFEAIGLEQIRLPSAIETNLYRIVQEALTNVSRHAQATRVDILLEKQAASIITIVEDNGTGFIVKNAKQTERLGLLGIRERTEMMNGSLTVESSIGNGTTILVKVPYAN